MESDPHSIIEGMAICACAIGAGQEYIYLRGKYSHLVDLLNNAIKQAQQKGYLNGFEIEVRRGAGAYVCGEKTALIQSIEGKRGEPRYKPPYPPSQGLWMHPTIINNVETLANSPLIIARGAQWYSSLGDATYPGTKIFTLSGDVKRTTFFETPTNISLRELIYDLGDGLPGGKLLKAVQVGGKRRSLYECNYASL